MHGTREQIHTEQFFLTAPVPTGERCTVIARSVIMWADHPSIMEDSNTGPRGDYIIIASIRFDIRSDVLALKNTNFLTCKLLMLHISIYHLIIFTLFIFLLIDIVW